MENSRKIFVQRTHKLLEQYASFGANLPEEEQFEMTLLINACVGLIFVGYQDRRYKMPGELIDSIGIPLDSISTCKNGKNDEPKTLKNVCKHIRNSIAHARFEFINANKKIHKIKFIDQTTNGTEETFNMTLTCEQFKTLIEELYKLLTKCPEVKAEAK